jgi:hypothetical protein
MKTFSTKLVLASAVAAVIIFLSGCFVIKTITQPATALGGAQITSTLVVAVEGIVDANPHHGIVGLLIPNGWTIDSVYFDGAYTDYCTFLHPDSADAEPGGMVDYWTDSLEARYPSGPNYMWVVYQSTQAHAVINDSVDVNLTVMMTSSLDQGDFNLGYFVTDAALDFTDPDYYSVALNNVINISGVIPVELTSFNASTSAEAVTLNWETATETNNRGFEVQRGTDKENFSTIGFVDGKGTTSEKSSYSFSDKSVTGAVYYYRLKQVDFNGTFEYSNTIEVDFSVPSEFALTQNYPNPFNPTTTLQFSLPVESNVVIKLYNSVGEEVAVLSANDYAAGRHSLNIDASNLASGAYIYTIAANGSDGSSFVQSKKMVLMK